MSSTDVTKTEKSQADAGQTRRAGSERTGERRDPNAHSGPIAGRDLIELLAAADSEQRERNLVWLQRSVGNEAVSRAIVDREPKGGGGSPFEGVRVSADAAAMRTQLEAYVQKNGLKALLGWEGRWFAQDEGTKGIYLAGLDGYDIDVGAADTAILTVAGAIASEGDAFERGLRGKAVGMTRKVLAESKKKIEAELEHYGVAENEYKPEHLEGVEGGAQAWPTRVEMTNYGAASDAKAVARSLAHERKKADDAHKAFLEVFRSLPGYTSIKEELPAELRNSVYDEAEQLWKMLEDLYTKQAVAATQEFPILAMYAGQDNPSAALLGFANMPEADTAQHIWDESKKRLANIETVDKGLDGKFNPLLEDRIMKMVLSGEGVSPWLRKVGQDTVDRVKDAETADKILNMVVAIGLGAVAAIPSGGSTLVAGVAAAAAASGAALAVYNAYETWQQYQLKSAATNTAFATAEAISKDEPSFFWLAVEVVGALAEVGAALAAFKALVKVAKEARAAKDVLKMADAVDAVAPPGARISVKSKLAGEMGDEAVNKFIVAEGNKFRQGDLSKIREALEQVKDEVWTEAYDAMAAQGRIKPLTPEAIREVLSTYPAGDAAFANLAEEYLFKHKVGTWQGLYCPHSGVVFVKPGAQHQVATVVGHEFVHIGQQRVGDNLNSFWAEFEAHAAQKRIIHSLDRHGINPQLDEKVAWLREADDMTIANKIKDSYGFPIPPEFTAGGRSDSQIVRAAIAAARKLNQVPL